MKKPSDLGETLNASELAIFLGESRSTLYANYLPDPRFPAPRRVGINGSRRWLKQDVMEYLRSCEVAIPIPVETTSISEHQRRGPQHRRAELKA